MTRITTYRCDGCGAVLAGSTPELRKSGKDWRFTTTHVSALTHEDIDNLRKAGDIEKDYCPKCVPDWVARPTFGAQSPAT